MLRETLLALAPLDGGLFDLLAPIHDAVLVECEKKDALKVRDLIKSIMERSWPELGDLSIEAEASMGKSWAEMEEF
jgi:DNA polymerase I-like protein with 3'-5' exonuclease and polymerase domains